MDRVPPWEKRAGEGTGGGGGAARGGVLCPGAPLPHSVGPATLLVCELLKLAGKGNEQVEMGK